MEGSLRYVVDELQIDEAGFELRRDGLVVSMEPKVFEFICYLVRHRQRAVSKHELLHELWRGTSVVDSVLARCACLARQSLGDPSLIRTIHGRGYRWMGA